MALLFSQTNSGFPFICDFPNSALFIYMIFNCVKDSSLSQVSLSHTLIKEKNLTSLSLSQVSSIMESNTEGKPIWFRAFVFVTCTVVCGMGLYVALGDICNRHKNQKATLLISGIILMIIFWVIGFIAVVVDLVNSITEASRKKKVAPLPTLASKEQTLQV